MAKIKSVSKVKSTSTTKKNKSPILHHKLQKQKIDKRLDVKGEAPSKALTIREHGRAIKHYLSYYGKGLNVKNALDKSLPIDIHRAKTQLKAFYIKTISDGTFKFTVKSSGLYEETSHDVHIKWMIEKYNSEDSKEVFLNAPIRFQCGCGRHTYWYRYLATKGGWSLGVNENRFPSIRNPNLKGIACKHVIKVLTVLHGASFQRTFGRYVHNSKIGKGTKVSQKDKASIAGSSFRQ